MDVDTRAENPAQGEQGLALEEGPARAKVPRSSPFHSCSDGHSLLFWVQRWLLASGNTGLHNFDFGHIMQSNPSGRLPYALTEVAFMLVCEVYGRGSYRKPSPKRERFCLRGVEKDGGLFAACGMNPGTARAAQYLAPKSQVETQPWRAHGYNWLRFTRKGSVLSLISPTYSGALMRKCELESELFTSCILTDLEHPVGSPGQTGAQDQAALPLCLHPSGTLGSWY
jgi:hypothetical protein